MGSRAAEMQIRSRYKIPESRQSAPSTTKRARVGRAGSIGSPSRASAEEKVMNGSNGGGGVEARRRVERAARGRRLPRTRVDYHAGCRIRHEDGVRVRTAASTASARGPQPALTRACAPRGPPRPGEAQGGPGE